MAENELISFPHLEKVLEEYAKEARTRYRNELTFLGKKATGDLIRNITFEIQHKGTTYEVGLNLESYWKYVEHGRRKGAKFPPINAIERWIQVKPVLPRPMKGGRLPTIKQLAFLIARGISRNGIPPTNAFERAKTVTTDDWIPKIRGAFMEDLGGRLNTMLQILVAKNE